MSQGESSNGPAPGKVERVLIVSESTPPQVNGMARRIGQYTDGLRKLGCKVDVLSPDSAKVWGFVNPWNFSARMMVVHPSHFFKLATSVDYDVVHAVMPLNLSGVWILAAAKWIRFLRGATKPALVCSWHCNLETYNAMFFPKCLQGPALAVGPFIFKPMGLFADRLLVPTPSTEPSLRAHFKDRWGICPNGLELSAFNPNARDTPSGEEWARRKARELKERGCTHLLVCVGRLSPEKGVADLLAVMPRLPHCHLWLVGDGPARPQLEEMTKEGVGGSGPLNCTFWGYQRGEALSSVYTFADCFVCPSLTETFGQTVNEALASGVPVAVPRVGCFVEAYDGILDQKAHMWTPGDEAEMAAAIDRQLAKENRRPVELKLRSWKVRDSGPSPPSHVTEPCPPTHLPTRPPAPSQTAVDELYAQYEVIDIAQMRRAQGVGRNVRGAAMVIAYPIVFSFTVFVAAFVWVSAMIRTALGGVGLRYFLRSKASQISKDIDEGVNHAMSTAASKVQEGASFVQEGANEVHRRLPWPMSS